MGRVSPTKNKPVAGMKFGKLTVIQRVADKNTKTANLRVQVRVECECGNRRTIPFWYLVRPHSKPLTECGSCGPKSLVSLHKREHNSWYMMNVRCTDPKHVAWIHYGGRGITVCERWSWDNEDGFANFLEDMGPRPDGMSIDRIDNDGHYELYHRVTGELQCRWATAVEQRANQRPRKN